MEPTQMRTAALIIALQLAGLGSSYADSTILKCTDSGGSPVADLYVDLANRMLTWGPYRYRIHSADERYISAYQETAGSVGGEIWVLNRATGDYLRAGVGIFWLTPDAMKTQPGKLNANTYSGKCTRQIL